MMTDSPPFGTDTASATSRLLHLHHVLQRSSQLCMCYNRSTSHPEAIQVTPRISLFDQKVHIRIQGLPASAKVTLHLVTEQEWRREPALFVSCSHHMSSQSGEVDLDSSPSLGGTYTGTDGMGLFWSLNPDPSGPQNIRMVLKNVEEPCLYTLSIYPGHLTLNDLHPNSDRHQPLSAATSITRLKMAADVRKVPVMEGGVRGTLFLPAGAGPHPGVIDMFGSSGGIMEMRAALLASHGFATLALPYFRYQDLPKSLEAVKFDYFEEALQWFTSQDYIKQGGVGIVAVSAGAMFGMLMAWKFPQVVALVQINGPNMVWVNDLEYKGKLFRKGVLMDPSLSKMTKEGVVVTEAFPHTAEDIIPVWESSAKVLIFVSDDDQQCNPQFTDELHSMYPESKRHMIQVVRYPGAGHLLEPPYTPFCRYCMNPGFDIEMLWGGSPVPQAAAQEDMWQRTLAFLRAHLL